MPVCEPLRRMCSSILRINNIDEEDRKNLVEGPLCHCSSDSPAGHNCSESQWVDPDDLDSLDRTGSFTWVHHQRGTHHKVRAAVVIREPGAWSLGIPYTHNFNYSAVNVRQEVEFHWKLVLNPQLHPPPKILPFTESYAHPHRHPPQKGVGKSAQNCFLWGTSDILAFFVTKAPYMYKRISVSNILTCILTHTVTEPDGF